MDFTCFAIGFISCVVSIALSSVLTLLFEFVMKKVRDFHQARLQNNEEGKDF